MWVLTLNALWALPVVVFYWSRRKPQKHLWRDTGASFGLVVAPASMGLYGLFYIHPLTAVFGILGLVLVQFHGEPGYRLAISLGLVESATVVRGVQHVYIAVLNGMVWAPAYGILGYVVDRLRQAKRAA